MATLIVVSFVCLLQFERKLYIHINGWRCDEPDSLLLKIDIGFNQPGDVPLLTPKHDRGHEEMREINILKVTDLRHRPAKPPISLGTKGVVVMPPETGQSLLHRYNESCGVADFPGKHVHLP